MSTPSSLLELEDRLGDAGLRGEERLGGFGQVQVAPDRFLDEPELVEVHVPRPGIIHPKPAARERRRRAIASITAACSPIAACRRDGDAAGAPRAAPRPAAAGRRRRWPPVPRKSGTTSIARRARGRRARPRPRRASAPSARGRRGATRQSGAARADARGDRLERRGPARIARAVGEEDDGAGHDGGLSGTAPARRRRPARGRGRARPASRRRSTASSCRAGRGGERRCSGGRS